MFIMFALEKFYEVLMKLSVRIEVPDRISLAPNLLQDGDNKWKKNTQNFGWKSTKLNVLENFPKLFSKILEFLSLLRYHCLEKNLWNRFLFNLHVSPACWQRYLFWLPGLLQVSGHALHSRIGRLYRTLVLSWELAFCYQWETRFPCKKWNCCQFLFMWFCLFFSSTKRDTAIVAWIKQSSWLRKQTSSQSSSSGTVVVIADSLISLREINHSRTRYYCSWVKQTRRLTCFIA